MFIITKSTFPNIPCFIFSRMNWRCQANWSIWSKLHKIELLHVHYAIPHAYAGYMAKQMLKDEGINLPMMTTLHGNRHYPGGKPSVLQIRGNFQHQQIRFCDFGFPKFEGRHLEIVQHQKRNPGHSQFYRIGQALSQSRYFLSPLGHGQ